MAVFGKPRIPDNVIQTTALTNLTCKDTWLTIYSALTFYSFDDLQFLTDDADLWSQSQAYQSSLRNDLAISVMKD